MTTMVENKDKKVLNVPHLRFPEFSGEWEKCSIQDYGEVVTGNTPPTSHAEYYKNGSCLWASPADLGINKNITETKTKLSFSGFKKTRNIPKGSVLVTCIGSTIGKMGMATETMSTNQQINSIVVNGKSNSNFVYYAICRAFPRYLSEVGVQAVPILSKANFEKLPNYTTCRKEQDKIGYFFNLLDERIATQNKIIEKMESLINGIYDKVLWQSNKQTSLSEILVERNERTTINNQYQVLSSTAKGLYRQSDYFDKEVASANNIGYKVLRLGDIVLSPQNLWLGNINYNDLFEIGIVSPSYKVFSIRNSYNPYYVSCFLKTPKALYEYTNASEQGASVVRRNLDINAFMAICFPMPNKILQDKTSERLRKINMKLDIEKQIHERLNVQKQYLLRQMFI